MPASRFASVIFDCDSTLSAIEGIEELAHAHREEIARLTEAAMRGEIPLEDVYGRRLELVRPTREQVDALGERYVRTLVTDAHETVAALLTEGIEVRVMSGGIRQAVVTLALALGLTERAVAAVEVHFDDNGAYAGFDSTSPLARSGGKRTVLERWMPELPRPVMLVGDGATDLEARPPADMFVAFAGVVERPAVIDAADVVVRTPSLAPIVVLALGGVAPRDPVAREVFELGRSLMRV
ncbi:MAG TPA: HAD-IB family phosphatase, partial [Gemmatimonadaceae bacterium]|nr:HAD-IB family phosphatase [Gemmatimonadaceae bacterium]